MNFSPNSKYIVSGSRDLKVKIWNLETEEEIKTLNVMLLIDFIKC